MPLSGLVALEMSSPNLGLSPLKQQNPVLFPNPGLFPAVVCLDSWLGLDPDSRSAAREKACWPAGHLLSLGGWESKRTAPLLFEEWWGAGMSPNFSRQGETLLLPGSASWCLAEPTPAPKERCLFSFCFFFLNYILLIKDVV